VAARPGRPARGAAEVAARRRRPQAGGGEVNDPAGYARRHRHDDAERRQDLRLPARRQPHKIIAEYRDHLAPGSYLAITHGTLEDDPAGEGDAAEGVYRQASSQLHVRTLPDVLRFFDGFELVEPGLAWIAQWHPEPGTAPTGRQHSMRGGIGRKT